MNPIEQGYEDERFQSDVHGSLHCPICHDIFKQPVQCRRNEHYFCLKCITQHLGQNSQTCPLCMEELTVETLGRPSRIVTNLVSELHITCDNASRGCEEVVELGLLKTHIENCPFSPIPCCIDGCSVIINKGEKEHHETQICEFRKLKCEDCQQEVVHKNYKTHGCVLRREISDVKNQVRDLTRKTEEKLSAQEELMKEMRNMIAEIKEVIKPATGLPRKDFLIAGGYDGTSYLNSAEKYVCSIVAWVPLLPPMRQVRCQASSFVHENQVFMCGGHPSTDTIESLDMTMNQEPKQWLEFEGKLPFKCSGQTSNIYQNRLIIIGGYINEKKVSDSVYEILIDQPHTSHLVCCMPQPRRGHGAILFNDKILIIGGMTTSSAKDNVDSIVSYDVNENIFKEIGHLPYAVSYMATVRHGNNLVVMGGWDVHGKPLNKVVMFNVETGKCEMLPNMDVERAQCTAIITGNLIVVMGGWNEKCGALSSVELFDVDRRVWRELPSMAKPRILGTAVVKP